MKTFLFNPYTGKPRHPSDIASDPEGLLIVDDGQPMRAASWHPPAALKLLPRDPTPEMLGAGYGAPVPAVMLDSISAMGKLRLGASYQAMFDAAPDAQPFGFVFRHKEAVEAARSIEPSDAAEHLWIYMHGTKYLERLEADPRLEVVRLFRQG